MVEVGLLAALRAAVGAKLLSLAALASEEVRVGRGTSDYWSRLHVHGWPLGSLH